MSKTNNVVQMYDLPTNQNDSNGLKTFVYKVPGGQTYIRATCETYNHNKTEVHLPALSAVYWYPLYFFYDWKHDYLRNTMILNVDRSAPHPTKDYFEDHGVMTINDAVEIHKPYVPKDNKIFQDNLGALLELEKWGLHLFTGEFTQKDVVENLQRMEAIMQGIRAEAKENYLKQVDNGEIVNPKELHQFDEEADATLYKYASEDAQRMLILIGCGERMTLLMSKIVKAKTYTPRGTKH